MPKVFGLKKIGKFDPKQIKKNVTEVRNIMMKEGISEPSVDAELNRALDASSVTEYMAIKGKVHEYLQTALRAKKQEIVNKIKDLVPPIDSDGTESDKLYDQLASLQEYYDNVNNPVYKDMIDKRNQALREEIGTAPTSAATDAKRSAEENLKKLLAEDSKDNSGSNEAVDYRLEPKRNTTMLVPPVPAPSYEAVASTPASQPQPQPRIAPLMVPLTVPPRPRPAPIITTAADAAAYAMTNLPSPTPSTVSTSTVAAPLIPSTRTIPNSPTSQSTLAPSSEPEDFETGDETGEGTGEGTTESVNFNGPEDLTLVPKYHLFAIKILFGSEVDPDWDKPMAESILAWSKGKNKLSKKQIKDLIDDIIGKNGPDMLVTERKSDGDVIELIEIIELQAKKTMNPFGSGSVGVFKLSQLEDKIKAGSLTSPSMNSAIPGLGDPILDNPLKQGPIPLDERGMTKEQRLIQKRLLEKKLVDDYVNRDRDDAGKPLVSFVMNDFVEQEREQESRMEAVFATDFDEILKTRSVAKPVAEKVQVKPSYSLYSEFDKHFDSKYY